MDDSEFHISFYKRKYNSFLLHFSFSIKDAAEAPRHFFVSTVSTQICGGMSVQLYNYTVEKFLKSFLVIGIYLYMINKDCLVANSYCLVIMKMMMMKLTSVPEYSLLFFQ